MYSIYLPIFEELCSFVSIIGLLCFLCTMNRDSFFIQIYDVECPRNHMRKAWKPINWIWNKIPAYILGVLVHLHLFIFCDFILCQTCSFQRGRNACSWSECLDEQWFMLLKLVHSNSESIYLYLINKQIKRTSHLHMEVSKHFEERLASKFLSKNNLVLCLSLLLFNFRFCWRTYTPQSFTYICDCV